MFEFEGAGDEMNLSMWMLLDELAAYSPKGTITDGSLTIEGFRLFCDEDTLSSKYVYIGYARDFFSDAEGNACLVHRRDVIFIENTDIASVVNMVISTFDKYRNWDERLQSARHDAEPYQRVLDIAHEMFRCPMFFGNKNLHIYAITQQYTKDEVYEEWDDVKALKTMPFSFLERWKTISFPMGYRDDVDPQVFPVWPGMKFEYQIRSNCYFDGKIWGHFYIYYRKKNISPTVLQLSKHVADIYSQMLKEKQDLSAEKYAMFSWLVDILDGNEVPRGTIQSFYWQMKWSEADNLTVYKVSPSSTDYDQMLLCWLCDSLSAMAADAAVFPYRHAIVVIVREHNNSPRIALDHIIRLISVNDCRCGVSFTFQGLQHIASYFRQAGHAIGYAPDMGKKIHYFKDCILSGLSCEIKTHLKWQDWVPPSLFKLIETDAAQGTEYYVTLYHLLVNKWHLGNAAKALYIHRNTLLYRLEKIENLMDVDIHDESVWAYLRICYNWMMEVYPVNVLPPPKDGNDRN